MKRRFARSALVRIESTDGLPPEKYIITYNVRGLYAEPDGTLKERAQHRMEVNLTLGYPRRQPQCKMLTPIFHPNITESSVCSGDFYAASEGLDDLVIRIGRMIAYQEFNVKSPLNGIAAKWAEKNDSRLPVDPRELAPSESTPPSVARPSEPPPLPRPGRAPINASDLAQSSTARTQTADGSLKVTREDQANAIRRQIDEAWQSRDFDKVGNLLETYAAVSGGEPEDLREVKAALNVERYLEESARACKSASAKTRSKAFSTAVAELDALPQPPESPSAVYETRLTQAKEQVEQAKREAADKWVLSVRNDVWQLCQGDKDRYARVQTALDELNKIPLSKEDRAAIREQITTEARRTRGACVEEQIERASAVSKWEAVLALCAELEDVDPSSAAAGTGKVAKLRQEAINNWLAPIDGKMRAACRGGTNDFRRVGAIIAEAGKIPLPESEKKALQKRLQEEASQERCQALAAKLKAACEQRDWPLVVALCDELESLDPKSDVARSCRKQAENGMRLDTGVLKAADAFTSGRYVECANQCSKLAKEHDAEGFRFETDTFKGTLAQLRERARKKEAEFLAAVDNVRKATDANDWHGVSHWAEAARKLKPKDETVSGLVEKAQKKRAQIKRRATFRAIRRAAALVMLCALAFFVYHHARLWYTFDSALKDADETAAFEAAKQVQWFYGPAARFVSALDERSLLKSAQIAATGILGYANDGNWSAAQRAFSEGQKAWETREFETAAERWGEARNRCQLVVRAATPFSISISPVLADAFVRLAASDNQQLAVERGSSLSLHATAGNYRMTVEHPDYEPHVEEVAIATGSNGEVRVHAVLTSLPGKLLVHCDPEATILNMGEVLGKTGEPVGLAAGEHEIEIAAEHYESSVKTVAMPANGEASLDITLQPLPRRLLAKCEPVATVHLDGRRLGKTDEELVIPVGDYKLTLSADGYKSKSFNAKVRPGRDVRIDTTLEFIPLPGKLLLTCTPQAQVFADGELVGVTGEPISLTEGEHHVELVADGYLKMSFKNLRIPLGRDVKWTGALSRIPGYLLVEATVPEKYGNPQHAPTAKLTIGNESKTVTLPHRETRLPPGEHKVQVEVQGYGEIPADKVRITSGKWTRMPLTIVPKPATVCLVPDPPDAKIHIYSSTWKFAVGLVADKKIGVGGEKLELMPFVQHNLFIKAKGFQETSKSFTLPYPGRHHGDVTVDLIKTSRWR